MSSTTPNTNPGNFANRPTEEVKAIASMGGKASHGNTNGSEDKENNSSTTTGVSHLPADATTARNADGTFTKGSEAAKEAGHLGGLHAQQKAHESQPDTSTAPQGRNPDGTFTKGSEAAKEAGHVGGLHAAGKTEDVNVQSEDTATAGRNADGTFKKGSEAAKEAGHKGGLAAATATTTAAAAARAESENN